MPTRIVLDPETMDLGSNERRIAAVLAKDPKARTYCGACGAQVFWTFGTGIRPDEGNCPMCGRLWTAYIKPGRKRPQWIGSEGDMMIALDALDASEILHALRNKPRSP